MKVHTLKDLLWGEVKDAATIHRIDLELDTSEVKDLVLDLVAFILHDTSGKYSLSFTGRILETEEW